MDILNKKERTKSFFLFLLMLLITFGTLFAGLFFNVKMPWKENNALRKENKKIRYELVYQKRFFNELKNIDKAIDSLSKITEGHFYVEKSITMDLVNLKDKIPKDSIQNYQFYDNVILNYKKLLDASGSLRKVKMEGGDIDKFNESIEDLEKENDDLQRALQLCRRLNRN